MSARGFASKHHLLHRTGLLALIRNGVDSIGGSVIDVYSYICNFAGTETLTLPHVTGSLTVSGKIGTSTPTIGAGSISFSAGTMGYLKLSDGTELIFEGDPAINQTTVYNIDGTDRHGTLVGAAAAPFNTPSKDVSYLRTYGGSPNPTNGVELTATIFGNNATNQIQDLGSNTFRWIGDGSSYTYIRFNAVTLNSTYRIVPTVLDRVSGSLKGNDTTDADLFPSFFATPDPKDDVITSRIEFGRYSSGQAIDITVRFSVQKVTHGLVPGVKKYVPRTSGIELSATIFGTNDTNQIQDLGNNTFRWVGDGVTYSYIRFSSPDIGHKYRIVPTVLNRASGSIKGSDASDSTIYSSFTATPQPKDHQVTSKIEFGRTTSGVIDITVQFSVQKIVPTDVSGTSEANNNLAGSVKAFVDPFQVGFPGYLNFEASTELLAADALLTEPFLFSTGTPRNITPSDLHAIPGGSLENVIFFGSKGIAIYSLVLPMTSARRALRALGQTGDFVVGMFSDGHYALDVTVNTLWAERKLRDLGVKAILTPGDNYEASLDGGWATLEEMQAEIAGFESVFSAWPSRYLSFSTGNHTFRQGATFEDFWGNSTLVMEKSVRLIHDVAIINIFNCQTYPTYTIDQANLDFLETELESARLRGNRVIVHMHIPIDNSNECVNASEIRSRIAAATSAGLKVLAVFAGHGHVYQEGSLPDGTKAYRLDGLRETKVAYLATIGAAGLTLQTITE